MYLFSENVENFRRNYNKIKKRMEKDKQYTVKVSYVDGESDNDVFVIINKVKSRNE